MRSTAYPLVPADAEGSVRLRRIAGWPAVTMITISSVTCLAFLGLAAQFLTGTHEFDRMLLFGLPGPHDPAGPNGPKHLVDIAWSMTALGSPEVVALLTAGIVGYLAVARRLGTALLLILFVGAGTLFAFGFKVVFEHLLPHHSVRLDGIVADTSFPSGHAMLSSLTYLTLAFVWARTEPRLGIKVYVVASAAALAGLVGISRIYLGLHWPSDVLAGWIVGTAWAGLSWICMRRLAPAKRLKSSGL